MVDAEREIARLRQSMDDALLLATGRDNPTRDEARERLREIGRILGAGLTGEGCANLNQTEPPHA